VERDDIHALGTTFRGAIMLVRTVFVATLITAYCCSAFCAAGAPDLVIKNEFIEVGTSKEFGGAITYVAVRGSGRNLVNNHDKGRQIQQSIYAGDMVDRKKEGQRSNWSPWPWNPVQAGDSHGNKSKMLEARSDGQEIYTKVQPMLWDMNNELAEAYYETWVTLDGPVVHVRNTVTCFRTDNRWNVALKELELPAVYTIGALDKLYTYGGSKPWTDDTLTVIPPVYPSKKFDSTEKWAANVNDDKWGLGVYNAQAEYCLGMFAGKPPGESGDDSTGYIAPVRRVALNKNSVFSYDYFLIVGTLDEIRAFVYTKEGKKPATVFHPTPPVAGPGAKAKQVALLAIPAVLVITVVVVLLRQVLA
jgi:hypothetical protein